MKIEFNLQAFVLTTLIVFAANHDQAFGQVKDWDGSANSNWTIPNNWLQASAPIQTDLVRIGNLPVAHMDQVDLNTTTTIRELQIYNGAALAILSNSLTVTEDTHVSNIEGDSGAYGLRIGSGRFLSTRDLSVTSGGRVSMENGTMFVNRLLEVAAGSGLVGRGLIDINEPGSVAFRNDGSILANSGALRINEFELGIADGIVDLDGFTENGQVNVNPGSSFHVNDAELEPFSGTLNMAGDAFLSMQLPSGWIVDGQINMFGTGDGTVGQITGGPFTLQGSLNATPSIFGDGEQLIHSETTVTESANVFVADDNGLEFGGPITIEGGNFQLGLDGSLVFSGMTNVNGGVFQTDSDQIPDGVVLFEGPTVYNGNLTINGAARQASGALIAGLTSITADVIDMDGNGSTVWDLNHTLSVNAGRIDSTSNKFDGTLNVTGSFAQLNVNLSQPDEQWEMAGTMLLDNPLPGTATRLAGSPVTASGQISVANENIRIAADTTFGNTSETQFLNASNSLVMTGETHVEAGAMFIGDGTMFNGAAGSFTLATGASLGNVAFVNQGQMEVADSAGIADVSEFENTAGGNWLVEIGGSAAGSEFDVLQVGNGTATLAGTLTVKLIDAGNGQFTPVVGDEFTILSAVGGVVGQFENEPVSIAGGNGYQWEVLYNSNDVTLRLANIIPNVFLGDVNQDGAVNLLDVAPFVELLNSGGYQLEADVNCDGEVNLLDVTPFIELIVG